MLLERKTAVIYGAGGAVGGTIARAFASEGASVFLAGRTRTTLEKVAAHISRAGGKVEIAELDPLDERSVELYAAAVVANAGGLDISFNAIGLGDTQGVPLVEISHEHFALPIINAMKTHFCTTTTAARHMAKKRSGVIMAITAQAGRKPYRDVGGFGVACAAIEGLCRQLAVELGSLGIRVVCLRSAGSPDAAGLEEVWRRHGENAGISRQAFEASIAEHTLLKRLPKLDEIANAAVLVASDKASAITAAVANVTCGEIAD